MSKLRAAAQRCLSGDNLLTYLPEAAQPFRQDGCAPQIISNGSAAVTGKDHHVFSTIRRRRRTPSVEGSSASGAEATGT